MDENKVSKSEFKAKALEFFRLVEASGRSVIVTDHGKPALEIRAYRNPARDPLDVLHGSIVRYDNPTLPVGEDDWESAR